MIGTFQKRLQNQLVVLSPIVKGHGNVGLRLSVRGDIDPELSALFERFCKFRTRNRRDAFLLKFSLPIRPFYPAPGKMHFTPGIDKLCANRKGIDIGKGSIEGELLHIAEIISVRNGSGKCPHQKLRFIHPAIISSYRIIGGIYGTVQNLHFRIL